MKRILLSLSTILITNFIDAQTLQSYDFNSLTAGDIGTTITGTPAGQDSWFTFASNGTAPTTTNNANVTNFQAVTTGNPSNGVTLTGPNGDKGGRFMWKNGLATLWEARTSGNNIFEFEADINTGAASTSRNTFGVYVYNAAGNVLAGFVVRASTKELLLVSYSTPMGQPQGTYNYSLAAAPGIQLAENEWSRVGVSINSTTGLVIIKGPGLPVAGLTVQCTAADFNPDELDLVAFSGNAVATPNTVAGTMTFDNVVSRASSTDTLLSNDDFYTTKLLSVRMFPNPAMDQLSISSPDQEIKNISIVDLNGRVVKELSSNFNQISLEGINAGVYLVNITTENGKKSEKLIIQ